MLIRIDDRYEKMLKEIAEVKGGDVAFNEIVERSIEFMYKFSVLVKNKKLVKEQRKNG